MSYQVTTEICCDVCFNQWAVGPTTDRIQIRKARSMAKGAGWIRRQTVYGMIDVCPRCKESESTDETGNN